MLETLGLGRTEEKLYRALLRAAEGCEASLANATGTPADHVCEYLERLVDLRLAERRPGEPATYHASPPDVAITALLNERQTGLDRTRLAVPELMADYQRATSASGPERLVEVCTGPGIGLRRFRELLSTATEEVLLFDRGGAPEAVGAAEVDAAAPILRRGVRCRSIYEVSSLSLPGRLPHVRRLAAMGEQSRVSRQLPMKMVVCDRRVAMLPLVTGVTADAAPGAGAGTESVILVEACDLLEALVGLFEAYWQRSTPMATGTRGHASTTPANPAGTASPAGTANPAGTAGAVGPTDPSAPTTTASDSNGETAEAGRNGETGETGDCGDDADGLTPADLELLRLLNLGLKDAAIARQLGVSMRTTRRRIAAVLEWLGVTTRFQAGIAAAKRGLL